MRHSSASKGWEKLLAALSASACLLGSGCTLVQPGCRNRDVTAAIENEARESVALWMSTSKLTSPSAETPITLADQVEVERHDTTRSCTANVMVGASSDAVAVPVEYEVIVGGDGEPLYRWDSDSFGKQFINTALASLLTNMARASVEATPSDSPPQQPRASPPSDMAVWQREVYASIFARAKKLTGMPSGTQTMLFRIGPAGDVTMAQAVEPIGNAELAEKLVRFLDTTARVAEPPAASGTWVKETFSF